MEPFVLLFSLLLGFQSSVTPIMEGVVDLHNHIFFFLILVFVFVFWVFGNILYDFWWKASYPDTEEQLAERVALSSLRHLSHSTVLEVVWTIIPSLILVAIAVPSFALMYAMDEIMEPTVTLKVVGHQWYWSYQYSNCLSQVEYTPLDYPELTPSSVWRRAWIGAQLSLANVRAPLKVEQVGSVYNWSVFGVDQPPVEVSSSSFRLPGTELVVPTAPFFEQQVGEPLRPSNFYDIAAFSHLWTINKMGEYVYRILSEPVKLGYSTMYSGGEVDRLAGAVQIETYPGIKFDSYMLNEDELPQGGYRLLEVDEPVVLPVNTHIRFLVTADDVIHSFAVPQLGVKVDAAPGRLNQQGVFIKRRGVFYGQCSELCGVNHGFMPIVVKAVSAREFLHWYIEKFGSLYPELADQSGLKLADSTEVEQFLEGIYPEWVQSEPQLELTSSKLYSDYRRFFDTTVVSSYWFGGTGSK